MNSRILQEVINSRIPGSKPSPKGHTSTAPRKRWKRCWSGNRKKNAIFRIPIYSYGDRIKPFPRNFGKNADVAVNSWNFRKQMVLWGRKIRVPYIDALAPQPQHQPACGGPGEKDAVLVDYGRLRDSKRIRKQENFGFSSASPYSFIRPHRNTGDTSANCRIKWGVTIVLLSRGRP